MHFCKTFFMKYIKPRKAIILLSDGTIFYGNSVANREGSAFGEVCFNTGMTGYQEIFTDPSYFGQLMVATNAHIGNYGVNDDEIDNVVLDALSTGDYAGIYSDLKGLDVSHVGIIIRKDNSLSFRHASSQQEYRKVVDQDFKEYIINKPGIVILRPK